MGLFDFFHTKKSKQKRDTSEDAVVSTAAFGDESEAPQDASVASESTGASWWDSFTGADGGSDGGGGGE